MVVFFLFIFSSSLHPPGCHQEYPGRNNPSVCHPHHHAGHPLDLPVWFCFSGLLDSRGAIVIMFVHWYHLPSMDVQPAARTARDHLIDTFPDAPYGFAKCLRAFLFFLQGLHLLDYFLLLLRESKVSLHLHDADKHFLFFPQIQMKILFKRVQYILYMDENVS